LVLIHNPANHAVVAEGEVVSLHATARSQSGLQRLEFWVDDQLIAEKNTGDPNLTNIMLVDAWSALQPGNHILIARAVSKSGNNGQATISIEVVSMEEWELRHTVGEGETLASIAEEYGVSPDDLVGENPGLGDGGVASGDELVIPDSEPPAGPSDTLESDDPAPSAEDDAPGSLYSLMRIYGMDMSGFFGRSDDDSNVGLRFELLELTADEFESLHCYIGTGLSPARWFPDVDSDQSTDESFELIGERSWNVGEYYSGESAPAVFWPQDQPLDASVTCVGIVGGGTNALELGTWAARIPPERWTGVTQHGEASGPDGSFSFIYRVGPAEPPNDLVPKVLETSPSNVRLDVNANRLRWDYNPRDDEEAIDGFRIYLNNNFQWVEPPDALATMLPDEWFNPPCGSRYVFSVTAYSGIIPDGPESPPGIVICEEPLYGCAREIEISFLTLETFDLGGDDSSERKIGDRGPAYGDFIANESSISFSGGSLGAGLDVAAGFEHNTLYDLFDMWRSGWWGFTDRPALTVDVPPDGTFGFSFIIKDRDDESSNDVICAGESTEILESDYERLDRVHEGTIRSLNSRCLLTYRFGPAAFSPVGSGEEGLEPLPWLVITDITYLDETNQPRIHISNTGTATWPWKDLEIELLTRKGESLGIYTWPEFVLETGESAVISQPSMVVEPPLDACALLDPNDLVVEWREASGLIAHEPFCPDLPDLRITEVTYDSADHGLYVIVENSGAGRVVNRTIHLNTYRADGAPTDINYDYPEITMEPHETRMLFLPGITDGYRTALSGGYIVVIDEDNTIYESDESNNTFEVVPRQVELCWCDSRIPHYRGSGSSARMNLTAEVLSGSSSEIVLTSLRTSTLTRQEASDWDYPHSWDQGAGSSFSCSERFPPISIMGDQSLHISIHAEFLAGRRGGYDDIGTATLILDPFEISRLEVNNERCIDHDRMELQVRPSDSSYDDATWFTTLAYGQIVP